MIGEEALRSSVARLNLRAQRLCAFRVFGSHGYFQLILITRGENGKKFLRSRTLSNRPPRMFP